MSPSWKGATLHPDSSSSIWVGGYEGSFRPLASMECPGEVGVCSGGLGPCLCPPPEGGMLQGAGGRGHRPRVWAAHWRTAAWYPCHSPSVSRPGVGSRWCTLCKMESHGCWMEAALAQPPGAPTSPQLFPTPLPTPPLFSAVVGGQG